MTENETSRPVVALAWSNTPNSYTYTSVMTTIESSGAEIRLLAMAKSYDLEYDDQDRLVKSADDLGVLTREAAEVVRKNTWHKSNAEHVMEGVRCVIFSGGWDISPSLYGDPLWDGFTDDCCFSAERDVSDYILISYCLEKNIPMLAICRSMQMMAVVSGASLIQDIPDWLRGMGITKTDDHLPDDRKDFRFHPIKVLSKESLLYRVTGRDVVVDAPSWHHQMVRSIEGTRLTLTGTHDTQGIPVIEVVERDDLTFCLGVQFHPEITVRRVVEGSTKPIDLRNYDEAMSFFIAIKEAGCAYKKNQV